MIIVSWNIRGLGKPKKRLVVRKLVRKHKVDVLILQETKVAKISSQLSMMCGVGGVVGGIGFHLMARPGVLCPSGEISCNVGRG